MYCVETIRTEQEWRKVKEEFNNLAGDYITRRFAWQEAWWNAYSSEDAHLNILKVKFGERTIGYLPLYLIKSYLGLELRLLGDGKACSDDLGVYSAKGFEEQCAQTIASHLHESGLQGQWTSLTLEGVRNNCLAMNRLLLAFRESFGSSFYEQVDQVCRVAELGNCLESYISNSVSSNSRKVFRKISRQYIDTGRLQAEFATTKVCALDHLRLVSQLHQSRWNSKGEAGCVAAPSFANFLQNLCANLFDAGEWFSVVVKVDGQTAAGMIGAMRHPFLCTYMSGMDPSLAMYRPGILMNLAAMKYAIENGFSKFDMMRGDEVYKSRLGAVSIPQYIWTAYAPRIVPRVLGRMNSAKTQIRQWVRQYRRELPLESGDA